MVGSDDLGGLGATEGPAVIHYWTPASLMPLLLPWLAVLLLLLRRDNRSGQAWWIWSALVGSLVLCWVLSGLVLSMPSEGQDVMSQSIQALVFGLAAVWLLAPALSRPYRWLTFVLVFLALAGFSLFSFAVREDWVENWSTNLGGTIVLGITAFALALALSLTGLVCRRGLIPLRFSLWLLVWLGASWAIVMLPFFIFVYIATGGPVPFREFSLGILYFTGACFVAVLPFAILSFLHPFFRDRLKVLLHVAMEQPSPATAATAVPLN